jgi:hypothetical protein
MPNAIRLQEIHLGTGGNPDTFNATAPQYPGQVGFTFEWNGNTYTMVQLAPNATTPAVGQLLFWMTKTGSIPQVTNVVANAVNGGTTNGWRNEPAGIIRNIATAGNYICMLVQGSNIPVFVTGTPAIGDLGVSDVSANVGSVLNITAGTAPTYKQVCVFRAVKSGNLANADVSVGSLV